MTSAETFLCKELLREYFGDVVADVGYFLATNGPCSLKRIVKETSRKNNQVRKALCVLVQHKLARFKQTKNKVVKYEADVSMMTQLAIFPRIIFTAKHLYGDEAELIVEEILQHGMMMMSTCVKNVMDRLQNDDSELLFQKVKAAFTSLVQAHFLKREPELVISDTPLDVPAFSTNEEDLLEYTLPKLSLKDLPKDKSTANNGEPAAKRQKLEDSQVDDGIYWSTSRDRFRQFMRDQLIVAAIGDKHGAASGEIARAVLRISEATTGAGAVKSQCVSAPEIARVLPKTRFAMNDALVKEYLRVLCNDSDHIIETFDEGAVGGSYYVNFKNAATAIATSSVLSYVKERFGSKSCRIFRLLLLKKHLEQKQVEEFAMIPSKESKGCLYSMLAENMLVMQEIPRTPDHAPSRTYYLFAVDLRKVVRMLLLRSYKILENLCVKRKHLIKGSQRLLDKQQKINAIKENLQDADQAQLDEIDEMMTSAELGQLTNHRHFVGKTYKAQIQVAKTVFIFDFYLNSLLLLLE